MTTPSAQTDRFVHDRLPPRDQWPELRYDLPELRIADQANLVERLLDGAAARGWADRPLLRSPQITFTYAETRERVDRIANYLVHELKLEPGNRVLLRGGNSIGMALSWLAVVKAGLIAVATMPLLRATELSKVIDKAQPVAAICDARLLQELEQAQQAFPALQHVLRFNSPDDPSDLGQLVAHQAATFTACPTSAATQACGRSTRPSAGPGWTSPASPTPPPSSPIPGWPGVSTAIVSTFTGVPYRTKGFRSFAVLRQRWNTVRSYSPATSTGSSTRPGLPMIGSAKFMVRFFTCSAASPAAMRFGRRRTSCPRWIRRRAACLTHRHAARSAAAWRARTS